MPVIAPSEADLLAGLQRLMPMGRIWPREPDAVQTQVLATWVPAYARLYARDNHLLVDSFPATAVELLPEWEATLGLPDPCAGPAPTIVQRQAQVVARLTARGGQSVPYFTAYAAQLGFPVTITEFVPARYGRPNYGKPRYGRDWAHVWRVTAPAVAVTPARYGAHRAGEPYASWGSKVLECELGEIKPAHTILQFAYVGAGQQAAYGTGRFGVDTFAP